MVTCFLKETDQAVIPIYFLTAKSYRVWLSEKEESFQQWVHSTGFKAKPANFCLVPQKDGHLQCVLLGIEDENDFWSFGALARQLPEGVYSLLVSDFPSRDHYCRACLAWGLGAYQFSVYREAEPIAQLLLSSNVNTDRLFHWVVIKKN